MSRSPNVFEKLTLIDDAVTLFINKEIYEGWEDVQITREINALASDFQMQLTDKWRVDKEPWRIQTGDLVHIHAGKKSILTGYVDKIDLSVSANERKVTVSGRSKTCDLVDCSVTGLNEYAGLNLQEIANKVVAPFKIPVKFLSPPGGAFEKVTVQQGESVFALLDRLARQRKLLMYPSYDGFLMFSKNANKESVSELVQGVNVLDGHATYDDSNRFSEYIVKGQNHSFLGDEEQSSEAQGSATDEGIERYRPYVLVAETTADDSTTTDRAAYEANIRAANAIEAEVQVQGWFQEDGSFWEINEIVPCDFGFLGIREKMLVKKVVFIKNNSGTYTTLSLTRSDAYAFDKKVKKQRKKGWTKGLR